MVRNCEQQLRTVQESHHQRRDSSNGNSEHQPGHLHPQQQHDSTSVMQLQQRQRQVEVVASEDYPRRP
eukprot:2028346-Alexandrium_andersonii.AAC.1